MVSINQVELGLAAYLDAEVLPKLPMTGQYDPLKKVVVATGAMYTVKRGRNLLVRYEPLLSSIGLINGDSVDIEGVREELRGQIPAEGLAVNVPLLGELRFYKADIDTIYSYIMGVRL